LVVGGLVAAAAGCGGLVGSQGSGSDGGTGSDASDPSDPAGQSAQTDQPDGLASTTTDSRPATGWSCRSVSEDPIGTVQNDQLIEASGVVASRQHDGVLWSHNDSGGRAGVFAVDLDGSDLGFFELSSVDAVDIEDIAIADGVIYLADVGDNKRARDTVTIHRFAEPDPRAIDGATQPVAPGRPITVRYPDGPTDAEAFLVDPQRGELVILGKNLDDSSAPTIVYSAPFDPRLGPGSGTEPEAVEMMARGSIDVADLTRRSSAFSLSALAFPGAVTGADISDDGSVIALRTYGSVWLFDRRAGTTVADALTGGDALTNGDTGTRGDTGTNGDTEPCEGGAEAETQGESVGLLPATDDGLIRYVTISEGRNPPVNLSVIEVGG
jgi:hypothetical protein